MDDRNASQTAGLSDLLVAFADATRRSIVARLEREGELPCSAFLDLASKTNLSYHLAKLRDAAVISVRRNGTFRLVSLRRAELDVRFPGLVAVILAVEASGR